MSAGSSGDNGQDFDLNLAPIIDCFTVLITYLLVSASFISLTVLDIGVAASGTGQAAATGAPPLSLSAALNLNRQINLQLTGGTYPKPQTFQIVPTREADWDLAALTDELQRIQSQNPSLTEINLSAQGQIEYKQIVRLIQTVKTVFPKVYLSD